MKISKISENHDAGGKNGEKLFQTTVILSQLKRYRQIETNVLLKSTKKVKVETCLHAGT